MSKIILLSLVFISLIGCNLSSKFDYDTYYLQKAANHQLYYNEVFNEIPHDGCIGGWLDINIEYRKDIIQTWKNPNQTILDGFGDCKDFAIIFLNISYVQFNKKGYLIPVNQQDLQDTNPENFNHMMVVMDGFVIDGQNGMRHALLSNVRPNGEYVYSFDEVFTY